jgi:hypothetical protein
LKRILFGSYLLWLVAMTLIFVPVLLAFGVAQGALNVAGAICEHVFKTLTFGAFN